MKILLITEVFPPGKGGSGRWLWELYRRLPASEVHVVTALSADAESFDKSSELPIHRLPLRFSNWGLWSGRGMWHYVKAWRGLTRIVSRVRPEVIHCGKCLPEGLLARAIQRWHGIPFLCYAHGEELKLARTSQELQRLSRLVLHAARLVVANSQFTKKLLLEEWGLSPERVAVMHPGVDTSVFVPKPIDPTARLELGWAGKRVIFTAGALQKRKGQDMLIQALPLIRDSCPNVLYSIVGEGWERDYLDGLVRTHDVGDLVQFRGIPTDEELIRCYQQCDVFALPNRQIGWDVEGFGIVLIEAQACGKAVIAGMSGGAPETLQPGVTGELITGSSAEELARVVVNLLTDEIRSRLMGERAREWVVERFDWNTLKQQAAALFQTSLPDSSL